MSFRQAMREILDMLHEKFKTRYPGNCVKKQKIKMEFIGDLKFTSDNLWFVTVASNLLSLLKINVNEF